MIDFFLITGTRKTEKINGLCLIQLSLLSSVVAISVAFLTRRRRLDETVIYQIIMIEDVVFGLRHRKKTNLEPAWGTERNFLVID